MLRRYDSRLSGNAWKVRILLTQLGLAFEAGYDMQRFPSIGAWLARVSAQPGWVPLVEEAKP